MSRHASGVEPSGARRARRAAAVAASSVVAVAGLAVGFSGPAASHDGRNADAADFPGPVRVVEEVSDVQLGPPVTIGGRHYFVARTPGAGPGPGPEVVSLDPATGDLAFVTDVRFSETASNITDLVVAQGQLYFSASSGGGQELWRADPATGETERVEGITPGSTIGGPADLTVAGGHLYFSVQDGGRQLWRLDLATGETSSVEGLTRRLGSNPSYLAALGDTLYLRADDGAHGEELWSVDPAGDAELHDLVPGEGSSHPSSLTAHGGDLYFATGEDYDASALWRIDGVTGAIAAVPGAPAMSVARAYPLVSTGGSLFFSAGRSGLWRIDGDGDPEQLSDPVAAGQPTPEELMPATGGDLYFIGDEPATGLEWWRADPATGDVQLVADIAPGPAQGASSTPPAVVGSEVYLPGETSTTGQELWRSTVGSGEAALVADLVPGSDPSNPRPLVTAGSTLYFTTTVGFSGDLWRTVPEEPDVPLTATRPRVTGTPSVGSRLTAVPGEATPAEATPSYRWYRGTKAIARATNRAYRVTRADRRSRLSVRVTWTLEGSEPLTTRSKQTRTIR